MKLKLFIKRILDILSSAIGLLLLLPLLFIVAIFIKIDSRGPVFFLQERIGKNGKIFKIIKFRTMVQNAEYIGDGLAIKGTGDTRITRTGRILRSTSIDELPQLINVLLGDMSLVGPRPPVTYHPYEGYFNYPSWSKKRFQFKPGITGLAQVTVRNSVSWDERMKVDIRYIENFSLLNDFKLILVTFIRMIKPSNIYS